MVVRDETYFYELANLGIELHDSCACGERGSALGSVPYLRSET